MRFFTILLVLLMVGLLSFSLYLIYLSLPGEEKQLIPSSSSGVTSNEIVPGSQAAGVTESSQFYKNMRFPDRRISYFVESACSLEKKKQVVEALKTLEGLTILSFYPSETDSQIKILCSELPSEPKAKGHFVAGEGGPTEVINTTLYSVINEGKISLFREEKCEEPNIALHEIFHVLGFGHNNNKNSILYATLNCKQVVDQYLVDRINDIYSVDAAPDLKFQKVDASKAGRYLDFEVTVINQGLIDADGVLMGVYADGKLIKEFALDDVDVGTKKILTVENLRIGRSTQNVEFIVDPSSEIVEIFENNNRIELGLSN